MLSSRNRPSLGPILFFAGSVMIGAYFTFAAVQGDYGLFRRAEILVEAVRLAMERDRLDAEVLRMENLTHRLSDDYLDLDLLDDGRDGPAERLRDAHGHLRVVPVARLPAHEHQVDAAELANGGH